MHYLMHESEAGSTQARTSHSRISLPRLTKVSNPKSIHGIYPYRGKISALDAGQVVSQFPRSDVLLDPFCGTGTILYEAQAHGMNAIGVDNNPLACTIARGKTQPVDSEDVLARLEESIGTAKKIVKPQSMPPWPAKYFHPTTAAQIMSVLQVVPDFSDYLLSAFYGAICVAARACNKWLWTSNSIGRINRPLRQIDFYKTLQRKVKKHLPFVQGGSEVQVIQGDTRTIHDLIPEQSVGVVYTSPPYFDALDYTGYYTRLVMEITGIDRAKVRDGLIQRYSTYKEDMKQALAAIDRVVREDALIVFVVGDKKIRGRLIRGDEFFKDIAPWENPYTVEREYSATASSIWDRINETKRKEQILVWDLLEGGA